MDSILKACSLDKVSDCTKNMGIKGKAVMASLAHWCNEPVRTTKDGKCFIDGCQNFIRKACPVGGGAGTDAALKKALEDLRACAVNILPADEAWKLERLRKEIAFLS